MIVPISALLFSACSSSKVSLDSSGAVETHYQKALGYYSKEDYEDAAIELEPAIFTSRATALEDDVLFLLGQSYYKSEQYLLAVDMYTRLLQQVPSSPYARQSQFLLAKSHEQLSTHFELDHEHTRKAIQQYSVYLDLYPGRDSAQVTSDVEMYRELLKVNPGNDAYRQRYALAQAELESGQSQDYAEKAIGRLREKLAKNTFFIARQYIQLKKYKAAGIYYDEVIRRYPDTIYIEPAWKGRIDALVKRKKWYEAGQTLDRYLQLYPDKSTEMQETRDRIMKNFGNS
ncbi:MAG: outer membrane protein assembly factor BamD [Chlorobi bacterium]|nr:outer membrane protein assembly factor BamD [Chlorobiota bacterium]